MIRIGVAGWDYADWVGIVYPSTASRRFDKLAYLSRHVDVLEINVSFHRPVAAASAQSWLRRTWEQPDFRFTAKAHRSITHEEASDPAEFLPSILGLRPILEAGKLGALLLQFPQSFHRTAATLDRLSVIVDALCGWPLVLEVRHASWDADAAEEWARQAGVGWCVVDQPEVGRGTARPRPRVTAPVGYLRLHGRNADSWFAPEAGRDGRYDYLYSRAELVPLAQIARQLAEKAAEVFVVQNNHFRGKALVNALQLKQMLTGAKPAAPASLVDEYPGLVEFVQPAQPPRKLF